ncbi:GerW family sporulation protein [Paenibacillus gansuensis]|uniref:GerW family sporulation protein n=1 Tax=Paenibacillus gansuensis TaxID=306542 RepID=A0ABW5P9J1_9BACL
MTEHPIQGLMQTAMENIKDMVDVNTIVGDPVETVDGTVIMPISKVGFGFAAGGSEFAAEEGGHDAHSAKVAMPFGGGSGGGISITPIAFLVVGNQGVKVIPLDNQTHILERLIDSAPSVVEKIQSMMKGNTGGQAGMSGSQGTSGGSVGQGTTNSTTNIIV